MIVIVDGEWFVCRDVEHGQEVTCVDCLTGHFGECSQLSFSQREHYTALGRAESGLFWLNCE